MVRWLMIVAVLFCGVSVCGQDKVEVPEKAAEKYVLRWRYGKGDEFKFSLDSMIEGGLRHEGKFEGSIVVTGLKEDGQGQGVMSFTKLYAIKELSGSGARVDGDRLTEIKLRCYLSPNGRLLVDSDDLGKLQKEFADVFEDLALSVHFEGLFFELPAGELSVGESWTKFQDNCTYRLKLVEVKADEKGVMADVSGVPTNPNAGEEVQGNVKLRFDIKNGMLVSCQQTQTRVKSVGEVLKSELRSKVKRSLVIERVVSEVIVKPGK